MGVGFGLLVFIVVVALVLVVFIMLPPHSLVKHVGSSLGGSWIGLSLLPTGLPVFIIGSSSLASELATILPNASIRLINLTSLNSTPADSIIILDWGVVRQALVNGKLNMSNPTFKTLTTLYAKGDFIAIYGNSNNYIKIAIVLEAALAKATHNRLYVQWSPIQPTNSVILAIPILPIPKNKPITVIAYGGKGPLGNWIAIATSNTK